MTDVFRVHGFGWARWKGRVRHPGGALVTQSYEDRLDAEAAIRPFRDRCGDALDVGGPARS